MARTATASIYDTITNQIIAALEEVHQLRGGDRWGVLYCYVRPCVD